MITEENLIKFRVQICSLGDKHKLFISKLSTWGGLVKLMVMSIPAERADMVEALTANSSNGMNMLILLAREIIKGKIFMLSLCPFFKEKAIKD